jgi:hypothetical protein
VSLSLALIKNDKSIHISISCFHDSTVGSPFSDMEGLWKVMLTAVTTAVGIMMLASRNHVERDRTRLIYSLVVPHDYPRPAQATCKALCQQN